MNENLTSQIYKDPNSGCWIWEGAVNNKGYGYFNRNVLVHRFLYQEKYGPTSLHVCHKCDNTFCVNPDHMFCGTQKQNLEDCKRKGRFADGSRNGHAKLTAEEAVDVYLSDLPTMELAALYGVSRVVIRRIKRGIGYERETYSCRSSQKP
jgi:hypothetical protein